jgi:predicted TIM-barrel fold metal-dependent hydrolase
VRLNIQSNGHPITRDELSKLLWQYADAVRPLGWVVQVYVPMPLIEVLEHIVPSLNVRFCIDHMGHPCFEDPRHAADPYQVPGFASLARLLSAGQTYVKLSAPYRVSRTQNGHDLEPMVREIIRLKGTSRVVFATDWPHTRFEGLDIRPWMHTVLDWCNNDSYLIDRLFKGNAEDLWGASKT